MSNSFTYKAIMIFRISRSTQFGERRLIFNVDFRGLVFSAALIGKFPSSSLSSSFVFSFMFTLVVSLVLSLVLSLVFSLMLSLIFTLVLSLILFSVSFIVISSSFTLIVRFLSSVLSLRFVFSLRIFFYFL